MDLNGPKNEPRINHKWKSNVLKMDIDGIDQKWNARKKYVFGGTVYFYVTLAKAEENFLKDHDIWRKKFNVVKNASNEWSANF